MKKIIQALRTRKANKATGFYINGIYVGKNIVWHDALEREVSKAYSHRIL